MKQHDELTISYKGKRKHIHLTIEEFPMNHELIMQIKDTSYQPEWKQAYLEAVYEEQLNNRRESRSDRHTSLDSFEYESVEVFGVQDSIDEALIEEELLKQIEAVLTERQWYLVKRCLLEGDSYSEVAREEGKDESAIRHAINRAKTKLKKLFHEPSE